MAVMVTHGGDPIPKSPFNISVAPPLDLGKVKVQGLNESKHLKALLNLGVISTYLIKQFYALNINICFTEVEVGKDQEFIVNSKGAGGQGKLNVNITSPSGRVIPCKVESDKTKESTCVKYIPPEEGLYKVDISYDGNPVPGSPFAVEGLMPADPTKVKLQLSAYT